MNRIKKRRDRGRQINGIPKQDFSLGHDKLKSNQVHGTTRGCPCRKYTFLFSTPLGVVSGDHDEIIVDIDGPTEVAEPSLKRIPTTRRPPELFFLHLQRFLSIKKWIFDEEVMSTSIQSPIRESFCYGKDITKDTRTEQKNLRLRRDLLSKRDFGWEIYSYESLMDSH